MMASVMGGVGTSADMDCVGMIVSHRNGHAPDPAGERTAAQQAAPVQGFHRGPLIYAKFTQALGFAGGKAIPIDMIDKGRLAQGELMKVQIENFRQSLRTIIIMRHARPALFFALTRDFSGIPPVPAFPQCAGLVEHIQP